MITAIFSVSILSGCGNTTAETASNSSTPTANEHTNLPPENNENYYYSFTLGVFIDWDSINVALSINRAYTYLNQYLLGVEVVSPKR